MKLFRQLGVGLLFTLPFYSCSDRASQNVTNERSVFPIESEYIQPTEKDSILIDIHGGKYHDYITNLDREQFLNNKLFVMGWAGLEVSTIDTTGRFIRQITRRGNGPGEIPVGSYVSVWQSDDGGIYVLTSGNAFMLFVYDQNANFRYSLRLFDALPDHFHPPRSSFHITEKDENGIFSLTLAVGSTLHSQFTKDYYEHSSIIGHFEINEYQQKILSAESLFSYQDFPDIEESLKKDKIFWFDLYPLFEHVGDKFYLTFTFSDIVYVLNEDFKVENEIKSEILSEIKKSNIGSDFLLQTPSEYYDLVYYRNKNAYSNLHIKNIQILNDLIIVQFSKPLDEEDFLPDFPTKKQVYESQSALQGFVHRRDQYWLIYDLNSSEENLLKLPREYGTGIFLDKKRILVEKSFDNLEGFYLMKYTLQNAISD